MAQMKSLPQQHSSAEGHPPEARELQERELPSPKLEKKKPLSTTVFFTGKGFRKTQPRIKEIGRNEKH